MYHDYLSFEQPIAELQAKIDELSLVDSDSPVNINDEIENLQKKSEELTQKIYSKLSSWQVSQVARHPLRPYTQDYLKYIFTDFEELHGDRLFGDDQSLIGGIANLGSMPVMILGHQKGRGTKEKVKHNFGMPRPEGYRKARRLMKIAEKFKLPILTFIDTPGAYPGMDSEERGINEAIARTMAVTSKIKVPIISTVTGEANSGGAIAIGIADQLNMLQYSTYTVITPEGCATILWKSSSRAPEAAESMGVTADRLQELGIVDQIIQEPLGGAHRDVEDASKRIKNSLLEQIDRFSRMDVEDLLDRRYRRLMSYGRQS
ncbi:MAG: acetyl-CoA carboxylase carboxyl transferase subunit alpha [Gammaproteobacteria bacterium]|nr:acetyl-CoA carboxylase carboxyl transferase subunit alpha [Gammaproteobacteria bacterium]